MVAASMDIGFVEGNGPTLDKLAVDIGSRFVHCNDESGHRNVVIL